MWVPIHNEEWDGDTPLGLERQATLANSGEAVFQRCALPWQVGQYEVS